MYFGQLGSSETEYRNHRNYVWMQDSLFKFLKRHNRYLRALDLKKKNTQRELFADKLLHVVLILNRDLMM